MSYSNFNTFKLFENVGINSSSNYALSMEPNGNNVSFHSSNSIDYNNVDIMSIKNIINKKQNEDLNLSSLNGNTINPVITINNNHSDCRIMTNLNVSGNINCINDGMVKTTGIGSFGSITTTGSGSFDSINCGNVTYGINNGNNIYGEDNYSGKGYFKIKTKSSGQDNDSTIDLECTGDGTGKGYINLKTNVGYSLGHGIINLETDSGTKGKVNINTETCYLSGKLGIGKTDPSHPLDVDGNIKCDNVYGNISGNISGIISNEGYSGPHTKNYGWKLPPNAHSASQAIAIWSHTWGPIGWYSGSKYHYVRHYFKQHYSSNGVNTLATYIGWETGTNPHDTTTPGDNSYKAYIILKAEPGTTIGHNDSQLSFTGQHRNVPNNIDLYNNINNYVGYIVCSTGNYKTYNYGKKILEEKKNAITINDALPVIELSNKKQQKTVFGVISDKEEEDRILSIGAFCTAYSNINDDKRIYINSIGEGGIWVVNTNGNLENGDYIQSSSVVGLGEKQDDDILHSYTVAKITCDCDFELNTDNYECIEFVDPTSGNTYKKAFVGCTYHCG